MSTVPAEVDSATNSKVRLSSAWESDASFKKCHECTATFNAANRRHHCRMCGKIFCHDCSSQRSLIPPSSIVLVPRHGNQQQHRAGFATADADPDRLLTYTNGGGHGHDDEHGSPDTLLYGKGLEERYKSAREPLRVCDLCHEQLKVVQEELRASNSNAVRFNSVDPTDARRLFNSPLAFTLGHEVRKAAYTLNNLLPLPKRSNGFTSSNYGSAYTSSGLRHTPVADCTDTCATVSPNMGDLDGVRIPARLLEEARGIAVLTVMKGGFMFGVEFGSGLVVARLGDDDNDDGNRWSAPSAIGTVGVSWGALAGAQLSDHVFLLMTEKAVELMSTNEGSFQLGADIGVAVGPLGRAFEANVGATASSGAGKAAVAPIYTYSLSKGFYAGASLDGKVIATRHRVNENFYGHKVQASDLLSGRTATPPAAQPLYDALKRCHVYATNSAVAGGVAGRIGEEIGCVSLGGGRSHVRTSSTPQQIQNRSDPESYYRDENVDDWYGANESTFVGGGGGGSMIGTSAPGPTPTKADRTYTMPSDFTRNGNMSDTSF